MKSSRIYFNERDDVRRREIHNGLFFLFVNPQGFQITVSLLFNFTVK